MTASDAQDDARLLALESLDILDTQPEAAYDDLVTLAAVICGTPVAILNLVGRDRQWGKALVGQESSEAPLDVSFCSRTIRQPSGVMVVPDTHLDLRFADNPLVTDNDPALRFYAGASISTEEGHRLGTVCVVDHVPRELDPEQIGALEVLARQAGAQLDLRRRTRDLEVANAQLRHLALHDPLTGLPNRVLVSDRIDTALERARRSGTHVAVLFCDLDGFKAVNDAHGHERGDLVLRDVAACLVRSARAGDTVGRLAGDEFVVVCEGIGDADEAEVVAERLRASVARPLDGRTLTMSVGVALSAPGEGARELLARADRAMYAEKTNS